MFECFGVKKNMLWFEKDNCDGSVQNVLGEIVIEVRKDSLEVIIVIWIKDNVD